MKRLKIFSRNLSDFLIMSALLFAAFYILSYFISHPILKLEHILNNPQAISVVYGLIGLLFAGLFWILADVIIKIILFRMAPSTLLFGLISKESVHYRQALVGSLVLMGVGFLLHYVGNGNDQWMRDLFWGNQITLAVTCITVFILPSISEEILYRLILFKLINRMLDVVSFSGESSEKLKLGLRGAVVIGMSALIFSWAHKFQYEFFDLVYIFILGLWYGYLRIKTNSITVPIAAHAFSDVLGTVIFICVQSR